MGRTGLLPIADKLLEGTLRARLAEARANGVTYRAIARELEELGISITDETVRVWCRELGVEEAKAS